MVAKYCSCWLKTLVSFFLLVFWSVHWLSVKFSIFKNNSSINVCGLQCKWPKYFIVFPSLPFVDREAEQNKTKLSAYNSSFFVVFFKTCGAILPSIIYAIFSHALRRKLKMCCVEIHRQNLCRASFCPSRYFIVIEKCPKGFSYILKD